MAADPRRERIDAELLPRPPEPSDDPELVGARPEIGRRCRSVLLCRELNGLSTAEPLSEKPSVENQLFIASADIHPRVRRGVVDSPPAKVHANFRPGLL